MSKKNPKSEKDFGVEDVHNKEGGRERERKKWMGLEEEKKVN